MQRREFWFKAMLWSLGVAAVFGVVVVLTADYAGVVGRTVATALITSAVSAGMWRIAIRYDIGASLAYRIAQAGCGAFYLLALSSVWSPDGSWRLFATALAVLIGTEVAGVGLAARARPALTWSATILAVVPVVALPIWLVAIWSDPGASRSLLGTALVVSSWPAIAAACLIGWDTASSRRWQWIGVAAAALGAIVSELWVLRFVPDPPAGDFVVKLLIICGSISAVGIYVNLLLMASLPPGLRWVARVAIATGIVAALLADARVVFEFNAELPARILTAASIVASLSALAVALISQQRMRAGGRSATAQELGAKSADALPFAEPGCSPSNTDMKSGPYDSIIVHCPRCQKAQRLPVGRSLCPSCQLPFEIRVLLAANESLSPA